ncbi:hypothetical protein AB1Y20_020755 [Prymnesium parvum]|uniref:HECT domain-containing protein n=1 Tax=Prymnesium parvum TaxID=97485 RepID=A0AB34JUI4_PRYPA
MRRASSKAASAAASARLSFSFSSRTSRSRCGEETPTLNTMLVLRMAVTATCNATVAPASPPGVALTWVAGEKLDLCSTSSVGNGEGVSGEKRCRDCGLDCFRMFKFRREALSDKSAVEQFSRADRQGGGPGRACLDSLLLTAMQSAVSLASVRVDLERLKGASLGGVDASPFRTAVRNIIAACRNTPLALAAYCREGVLPLLANALAQVSSSAQLANYVLEVSLCLGQQLLEDRRRDSSSYAVGDSVMARRLDGDFGEGTILDALEDGSYLVAWNEEDVAAKLETAELMPFGSGMGLSTERRQRAAPAFILNNFLMKTAIPSNDLSRVQMVVRDGADVNCTDGDGNSPLNLAVSNGASVALIQFLISRGAHVNFVGAAGSALQIAAIQDNVEVVRCLLAHGADAALVDLDACAAESAELLRGSLAESESSPSSVQSPLSDEEVVRYGTECFCQLVMALLAAISDTQSPKQHKRVLMVLSFLVQRASEAHLSALSPQQLGVVLSNIRTLLASPNTLDHFFALRMLCATLRAWPAIGSTARRHGIDILLEQLASRSNPSAEGDGSAAGGGHSSRARTISLKPSDVTALAQKTCALLAAIPVDAHEGDVQNALAQLPSRAAGNFGGVVHELSALLLGTQPPSAHELQRSGTISWLLAELGDARASELRQRWAEFERAFPTAGEHGGQALEHLLQLLHSALVASEKLPVHIYTSGGEVPHSLKPLSEPIQICLHPLQKPAPPDDTTVPPPPNLSIDPLVRMRELQLHLLRCSTVSDTAYEAFCTRLIGCVVEERPRGSEGPFRRATVSATRTVPPLKLRLHTLLHEDGRQVDVVMATREYRIIGRVPTDQLARTTDSQAGQASTVADPEARIHTVNISCPEGLPIDMFLENVLSEIRRALRQAESGYAPMTRGIGEDYGWRDRGWERGGAQFERSVADKLRENGIAAVARRQTKHEAETLVTRLQNVVMVGIEVERPTSGNDDADDGGERFPVLCRVQGLVATEAGSGGSEQAHWLNATVVDTSGPSCSLVYDDGSFEAAVPAYRVRPVPQPETNKRLNPLAAIFMSFEQFLSSRDERRAEMDSTGREAMPANLTRSLSVFHLGRAQQVGHVQPEALEDNASVSDPMDTSDVGDTIDANGEQFDIAPMKLNLRFKLGTAAEPPREPGVVFDEGLTLLHCLQRLRETTPSGRSLTQDAQELGYHPGVTCDRTGQCPIIGNRFKLKNENYDVCEAEYLKMPAEERAKYNRIPPPCFRKPKGCGPTVWHLWYSIEVAQDMPVSPSADRTYSTRCGEGSRGSGAAHVPWTGKEVESGLLSGRLDADQVLRELRRAVTGTDLRLSESAMRMLSESAGGRAMAPLCPAQLMAAYREVCNIPRAMPTAVPPIPSSSTLREIREELSGYGVVSGEFSEALLLLWLLSQRILRDEGGCDRCDVGKEAHLRKLFMSSRLSAKLHQQLTDALAVSSGALPLWCRMLLSRCPALFSPSARSQFFRSSAFGVSRALHWSQEQQVSAVRAAYAEELAALERARLEAEVGNDHQGLAEVVEQQTEIEDRVGRDRLGALKSDIARVRRDMLLRMAERLIALHAPCGSLLEIQFEGESGFGSGVTQNFYSAVANELLKVSVNMELPIWMAETAGIEADGFISHPGSLFPCPLPPGSSQAHVDSVCARFRFLGQLMAKSCRDSFIVPLPLSRHFLQLVRGGVLSYDALPPPGSTGGVASGYATICAKLAAIDAEGVALGEAERRQRYEKVADAEFAQSVMGLDTRISLRDWLLAGNCCFVCPVTGAPLCDLGDERELTVHNLQEYVHLLAQLWLADGVHAQALAFRRGIEDVFPFSMLEPFTLQELQTLLCGTMSIEWSEAELQRHLHPSGGYTKHSKVYQLLIDELQRMANSERAKFLNFVTACPHLPPVGLSMLEIEVLPQHNGFVPTAQTCGNKLYLPEYDDPVALRNGLAEAFANADYGGLHERAGL